MTQARSQIMTLAGFIPGHLILHLGYCYLHEMGITVIQCYLLKDFKGRNT